MEVELAGERVVLLPPGGAYLPAHRAVLVSDLHLGKGAAFRAAGRPVPAGTSKETLERLTRLLSAAPPGAELWILGDLFHSVAGVTSGLEASWREWRARHAQLEVVLVPGNHDRRLHERAEEWGVRVEAPPVALGRLDLRHEPRHRLVDAEASPGVAGHLHPVIRLREGRRSGVRLPCFWLRGPDLVLPALGAFVDGARIRAEEGDRIFVPVGDQVLEIPPAQLPSSASSG